MSPRVNQENLPTGMAGGALVLVAIEGRAAGVMAIADPQDPRRKPAPQKLRF